MNQMIETIWLQSPIVSKSIHSRYMQKMQTQTQMFYVQV